MNDKKNNYEFNGINTQILNTAFDSMRNLPERATTSKDFVMGAKI
jgi:hypothetical protein